MSTPGPTEEALADPYHARVDVRAKSPRTAIGLIVKIAVSAGLIALVLSMTDFPSVALAILGADARLVLSAFALIPLGVVIGAFRWRGLLLTHGVDASHWFLVGSGCVAGFVRLFLPSTIGGDAVRIYDSWRAGASKATAIATIGVDRLLGFLSLALLATGGLAFSPHLDEIPFARLVAVLASAGLVLIVGWIFLPTPPIPGWAVGVWSRVPGAVRRPFDSLFGSLDAFTGQHLVLLRSLALSFLLQLNVVTFYWLIALGLGLQVTYAQLLIAAPIATFVMLLPITINGVGLREVIWVVLLGAYGFDEAMGIALSWIELGLFVAFGLVGGLVYLVRRG